MTRSQRSPISVRSGHPAGWVSTEVLELCDRYGVELLTTVMHAMLERCRDRHPLSALQRTARRLVGEAEGYLDDDGRGGPPTRIHVCCH